MFACREGGANRSFIGWIVGPFCGLFQFLLRLIDMAHRRSAVPAELGFLFVIGFGHGLLGLLEQLMRLFQVRMVFPIYGVGVAGQRQRNQRTNQYCFHAVLLKWAPAKLNLRPRPPSNPSLTRTKKGGRVSAP